MRVTLADTLATLARSAPTPANAPSAHDWTTIAADTDPFARLVRLDERLVSGGFVPMSDWWRHDLAKFYESGKRWGVYLVGRGGGKSTTLTRVSVAETMFTSRAIPPGQSWIWPFISASTGDARRRIVEIATILGRLAINFEPSSPQGQPTISTFDACNNPVAFVALAGTIAAVSGPSSVGATVDEEQKLRDKNNVNPAREIIISLVETFRARAGIRAIRCSSAFSRDGSHASSIAEGDTMTNHIGRIGAPFLAAAVDGFAEVARWEEQRGDRPTAERLRKYAATLTAESPRIPTWLANPTITAVASRIEVNAVPPNALDGLSRSDYWLRENGSVLADDFGVASGGAVLRCIPGRYADVDPRRNVRAGVDPVRGGWSRG